MFIIFTDQVDLNLFFWGNSGTSGPIHNDFPLGFGWLYLISGRKRIILFPPENKKLLVTFLGPNFTDKYFSEKLKKEELEIIHACGGRVALLSPGNLVFDI